MRQSIVDWHVYLTVDPCGDETYAAAIDARAGDQRIRIKKNATRQ